MKVNLHARGKQGLRQPGSLRPPRGWAALAALLVCLPYLAGCSAGGAREAPTPTPLPTSAAAARPTFTVQRGEVVKELMFKGRVTPVVERRLFFRSSGYVRRLYVAWGDAVKAGQILADLEIGDLENQLAQAEINLRSSELELASATQVISDTLAEAQISLSIEKLRLEEARYFLERDSRLPQKIAVQIQEEIVRLAELRLERLQRGPDPRLAQAVDLARLTVERLQAQVADSSILAPFDGQVRTVYIQEGDYVSAFSQSVISVYDPAQLEVSVELSTSELEALAEGMQVMITLSNRPGQEWSGSVRRLPYPYGTGEPAGARAEEEEASVRLSFDPAQGEPAALGEIVDVHVILERKEGVLWLPPEAIRSFEGRRFVVVLEDGRQRRANLTLGIESDSRVEILEGLAEGQVVVSP
jgi:multidrug efflux pump subunit AcrA (membrane-fusion protein)